MTSPETETYYRCTIIRGKTQREMDDLLPAYAGIIGKICPCPLPVFNQQFNGSLAELLFNRNFEELSISHKKTIRNHITEIAGRLLGLYWVDEDEIVHISASAEKVLSDNDQPAFFKNLCLNFQFPNGSQKINTILERINDGIRFKPFHFIVTLLSLAHSQNVILTQDEIAYYVLGSRATLRGERTPQNVLTLLLARRRTNLPPVKLPPGSFYNQHIKEQLNLLELANIIRSSNGTVVLNTLETNAIQLFMEEYNTPLRFNMSAYDLTKDEEKLKMYSDWGAYYGSILAPAEDVLSTTVDALRFSSTTAPANGEATETVHPETEEQGQDEEQIGDAGEQLVLEMEKQRVGQTHPRLVNKVVFLGKQRGLGYDISSVEAAENTEEPEFGRLIEVKSTKRTTIPSLDDPNWRDAVNLTRKEWIAARQYREAYNIYRVYFTVTTVIVRKINNPYLKFESQIIDVIPTVYRMDFSATAIDREYSTP